MARSVKLPVFATVENAFSYLFSNMGSVIVVMLIPSLLLVSYKIFVLFPLIPEIVELCEAAFNLLLSEEPEHAGEPIGELVRMFAPMWILIVLFNALVLVPMIRQAADDQRPGLITLNAVTLKYLVTVIIIMPLLVGGALFLIGMGLSYVSGLFATDQIPKSAFWAAFIFSVLLSVFICLRAVMIPVHVAVSGRFEIWAGWRMTRGNTVRLLATLIVMGMLLLVVLALVEVVYFLVYIVSAQFDPAFANAPHPLASPDDFLIWLSDAIASPTFIALTFVGFLGACALYGVYAGCLGVLHRQLAE